MRVVRELLGLTFLLVYKANGLDFPGFNRSVTMGCTGRNELLETSLSLRECIDFCANDPQCVSVEYVIAQSYCRASSTCTQEIMDEENWPDDGSVDAYVKTSSFNGYSLGLQNNGCVSMDNLGFSEGGNAIDCLQQCSGQPACISFKYSSYGNICQLSSSCSIEAAELDNLEVDNISVVFFKHTSVPWGYLENTTGVDLSTVQSLVSSKKAYAVVHYDGTVSTWGDPLFGGNSVGVDFSGGVKSVSTTYAAFAALKNDGTVVSWGDPNYGGDSSAANFTGGVTFISTDRHAHGHAFAALKKDGQ